ncbi:RHE_PE00001 family protein [Sinorhizobium sp. P24N7]|uniref:RHE_PE00001 family protein n=1 Tax=Sinorhizobium TaxID=28105 RepID=UPI0024B25720|nr:RHE_PE00001 family protein [Sinorhizobium terangae]WFU51857.1 RHE_PE00001 family protein [Sinorhizobium terangae]
MRRLRGQGAGSKEVDKVHAAATAVVDQRPRRLQPLPGEGRTIARCGTGHDRRRDRRVVLTETEGLPPVLRAALLLDAWNELEVLQHVSWLGRLLAAEALRQAGLTTAAHLTAVNLVLKTIAVERRRHRARDTRLLAILNGVVAAAEFGLKEHDRLALARQMMERRLVGRRSSSNLPGLIEIVISRPLVSAGMVAEMLKVTPRAALRIVGELGLREMTGRGRFRAWGIL